MVNVTALFWTLMRLLYREREEKYTSLEPNTYDSDLTCRKCGWSGSYLFLEDIDPFKYCPGCRREIQERR